MAIVEGQNRTTPFINFGKVFGEIGYSVRAAGRVALEGTPYGAGYNIINGRELLSLNQDTMLIILVGGIVGTIGTYRYRMEHRIKALEKSTQRKI